MNHYTRREVEVFAFMMEWPPDSGKFKRSRYKLTREEIAAKGSAARILEDTREIRQIYDPNDPALSTSSWLNNSD